MNMERLEALQSTLEAKEWAKAEKFFLPQSWGRLFPEDRKEFSRMFLEIPEDIRISSPAFCVAASADAFRRGDAKEGRKWQGILAARHDGYAVAWLNLQLPQNNNAQLLMAISALYHGFPGESMEYGCLSATGGLPSVLRGVRDLSQWGKHCKAVCSIVRPMLERFLADGGRGACEAAAAELFYEKNRLKEAAGEAAKAAASHNPEIMFAGMAQQMRIHRLESGKGALEAHLKDLEERISGSGALYLMPNFEALQIRFWIEEKNREKVGEWLAKYPANRPEDDALWETYLPLTQARAYQLLDRHEEALTLLKALTATLSDCNRPMDMAECLMLSAISNQMLGADELALLQFGQALEQVRPYGYIRIFADFGEAVLRLLESYRENGDDAYLETIRKAAREFGEPDENSISGQPLKPQEEELASEKRPVEETKEVPALEEHSEEQQEEAPSAEQQEPEPSQETLPTEALSQKETEVLRLTDEGKSIAEIAEQLSLKAAEVKGLFKALQEKLGAENRTKTIEHAKKRGLI